MNHNILSILICAVFVSSVLFGHVSYGAECAAPELSDSNDEYNALVCSGIESMNRQRYSDAVDAFKKASKMTLFEYPNYMLLPRLALAHHRAGNKSEAEIHLDKSELVLQVLTRLVRCAAMDEPPYFKLVRSFDRKSYDVDSPHGEDVANIMCGDMY